MSAGNRVEPSHKSGALKRKVQPPSSVEGQPGFENVQPEIIQRIKIEPSKLTPGQIYSLQRAIGNKALRNLIDQDQSELGPKAVRHPIEPTSIGQGSIQRHSLRDAPPVPDQDEESQAIPGEQPEADPASGWAATLQRHSLANAPAVPEEEEIQKSSLIQRAPLPGGKASLWARNTKVVEQPGHTLTEPALIVSSDLIQRNKKVPEARVQIGPIRFNKVELPADGKSRARALAQTRPGRRPVRWSIEGADFGCKINTRTGLIKVGTGVKGEDKKMLRVKATDVSYASKFAEKSLPLWEAEFFQAKVDFLKFVKRGSYQYKNFVTHDKFGKFDVKYEPLAKQLTITVRVKFIFPDDRPKKGEPIETKMQRFLRQAAYRQKFRSIVTKGWGGKYPIHNVREPKSVWDQLNPVTVNMNISEVASGYHYVMNIKQFTKGRSEVSPAGARPGTTTLYKGAETQQKAYPLTGKDEVARVQKITPKVSFAPGKSDVRPNFMKSLNFLADYLKRINNPEFKVRITGYTSKPTTRHSLWARIWGAREKEQAKNKVLSLERAAAVSNVLTGRGMTNHPTVVVGKGESTSTDLKWNKAAIVHSLSNPKWYNKEDVTMHEFGHMLGLDDEYKAGRGKKTEHYGLVEKHFGPEYADQVALQDADAFDNSASVMHSGTDLRPHHYVTLWDALSKTTMKKARAPKVRLSHDDWKIQG